MKIEIDGVTVARGTSMDVTITHRPKTVLIEAYVWAGHQCSAYEGETQKARIVRPTLAEALAELRSRLEARVGESDYVMFGGQARHVECLTAVEIVELFDDLEAAIEESVV